jgi:excisionase family DNA binding protein
MTTDHIEPLYTKEQVAQMLGVKESWLNSEIQAGNIPHLRLGRKKFIRFTRAHIETYLASREHPVVRDEEDGADG